MNAGAILRVVLGAAMLSPGLSAVAATFSSDAPTAAHRGVWEKTRALETPPAQPFFDVEIHFIFTLRDGREVEAEGVLKVNDPWAGRAYCAQVGTWKRRSATNQSGLDGRSGSLEVKPSDLPGKLREHPDDPRPFACDNGRWSRHTGDKGYHYVAAADQAGESSRVGRPPETLGVDSFYEKYLDAGGIPVLASAAVSDYALHEAAYLVDRMLEGRPELRKALAANGVRVVVMGVAEMTTDVPEHSHLRPKQHWDRRARGLGATRRVPVVSCGEENLLGLRGDPYATESIFVHEFAHTIDALGLREIDEGFEERLRITFRSARERGLWEDTYAGTNPGEYWAEGVQSWFDTNRAADREHNGVNTRERLKEYDPALARLIADSLGDTPWRYLPPRRRAEPMHLEGFDRAVAPRFAWPERAASPQATPAD